MALAIASSTDLGPLDRPHNILRDGGQTAPFGSGGKMLWTFGDSMYPGHVADNSADLSPMDDPTAVESGEPNQFIPHTDFEQTYNDANGPSSRYALWNGYIAPMSDGSVALFFGRIHITPDVWENTGVYWATAHPGDSVAKRGGLLFDPANGPIFNEGGGLGKNGAYIFLYSSEPVPGNPMQHQSCLARAKVAHKHGAGDPTDDDVVDCRVTSWQHPEHWRFWDGAGFQTDPAAAVPVVSPGASSGLTLNWNNYLGAYLMTYMKPWTSDCVMRTAAKPQGPWSAEVTAFTGLPSGGSGLAANDYAAFEHHELASATEKQVVVSYYHPLGDWNGEHRLVRVTFA